MKMKLCALLLLVCLYPAWALTPQPSLGCEDPANLMVAREAVDKINADRQEGYLFSFNLINDLTQSEDAGGLMFNLPIGVMETECHVISRNNQSQCEIKGIAGGPAARRSW
ncbi:hypothetical protein AGOR_G00145170 [Albula goreensis]|uniref:Uncharacterized protein n=1 Tax=Albula goreensis TaxID=1534307 RepID=A0A8T3D6E0_9TELE|nr:hypothetical protein AGOR_G00145170 [Albula goreensis]